MTPDEGQLSAAITRFYSWSTRVTTMLENIEAQQRRLARRQTILAARQHRYADQVVARIAGLVSRRAAILFAIGMMVGSALGSAGGEVIRPLLIRLLGGR